MGICIIIPAYNADQSITAVVVELLQFNIPLLVVDDGSTDGTATCVERLPANLLRHRSNLGKGAALKSGFAWALQHGFARVVTIDADGQHDMSAVPLLIAAASEQGCDILLASRHAQFEQMGGLRRWWNRFGAWCMRKLTGFDISDSQSGFRYYSARLLRGVSLVANGYHLEMEVLLKAWRGGYLVGSVPVAARVADGRATSHYRAVRDTWQICMTFLRYSR